MTGPGRLPRFRSWRLAEQDPELARRIEATPTGFGRRIPSLDRRLCSLDTDQGSRWRLTTGGDESAEEAPSLGWLAGLIKAVGTWVDASISDTGTAAIHELTPPSDSWVLPRPARAASLMLHVPLHRRWEPHWGGSILLGAREGARATVVPNAGIAVVHDARVAIELAPVSRTAPHRLVILSIPLRADATTSRLLDQPLQGLHRAPPYFPLPPCAEPHRIAVAASFVASSPAMRMPHGATTLGGHLLATAGILANQGERDRTVLAGMMHALCGTVFFRQACFDPVRDRATLAEVFTDEAVDLALIFASLDRKRLHEALATRSTDSNDPVDLRLEPHGPLSKPEIRVSSENLAALGRIEDANERAQVR